MNLSQRDLTRLEGVHVDLVRVVRRAAELMPDDLGFIVVEGVRSREKQAEYVRAGASQTMNSRHLTGHAVDLAPTLGGVLRWDWPLFHRLAPLVKQAADEVGVTITWGGDWHRFKDGPHFELPRGGEYT